MKATLEKVKTLSRYRKPSDLVFTASNGSPINRRNLLNRHLKPKLKKLGLPPCTFHDLRHLHSQPVHEGWCQPGGHKGQHGPFDGRRHPEHLHGHLVGATQGGSRRHREPDLGWDEFHVIGAMPSLRVC